MKVLSNILFFSFWAVSQFCLGQSEAAYSSAGKASYYAKSFSGAKTASGEVYNPEDYTCAHRSLPFGTYLRVKRGQRSTIVRVTDRGPHIKGRVVDLSYAAAKDIGLDRAGVAEVELEVVDIQRLGKHTTAEKLVPQVEAKVIQEKKSLLPPEVQTLPSNLQVLALEEADANGFGIQIGNSATRLSNLEAKANHLLQEGYASVVIYKQQNRKQQISYRLFVAPNSSKKNAYQVANELIKKGISAQVINFSTLVKEVK